MARALMIMGLLDAEADRSRCLETSRLRRQLRANATPTELSEPEFQAHYRLSKHLFLLLCSELRPILSRTQRRTKISVECKVLTTLAFYASGSYQKPVGMNYLHNLSQASVSNIIREVTLALNHPSMLSKYIKFPQTHQERNAIVNGFYNEFGFPGVLGCVDCTHVALVRPILNEERFFNRKHYHSRNVQIICDSDLNILNVDATFGGATHDSYIWRNHVLNEHLQQLHRDGENIYFLGDSGYGLRPWLLTPIVGATAGSAEAHYTDLHCRTRNTVERCIGVLKARWRCLLAHRVLHYDDKIVAAIINACVVLHNMANQARLPVDIRSDEIVRDSARQVAPNAVPVNLNMDLEGGQRTREYMVQRLWNWRE